MLQILLLCSIMALALAFNVNRALTRSRISRGNLEMKGKGGKVPVNQRGEYLKQMRMMEQQNQMKQNQKEGVPIFKVFVRPKAGGLWIPCGDLAGDERATAVVNAYMSGFMTDMYKGQLDNGIARSIFAQEDQFVAGLIDNYKPFKKFTKDDLEFGYKVEFEGLEEKMGEMKITVIEKGMEKNWGDNVRDAIGGIFNSGN